MMNLDIKSIFDCASFRYRVATGGGFLMLSTDNEGWAVALALIAFPRYR
jgi:hypothetical protein